MVIASQALAQDSPSVTTRPDPEGVATPVSIGLFLIDIAEIDDVAQTFKGDVFATLTWQDPRLALPPGARDRADRVVPLSEIWNPALTLINRRSVQILAPDIARIAPDGRVTFEARRFAEFASPLNLHDFPFDTQELRIDLASTRYGPDEIELSLNREAVGRLEPFSIAGWEVELGEVRIADIDLRRGEKRARFVQSLTARRESTFFLMKVILPVSLIVFMAWTVFLDRPGEHRSAARRLDGFRADPDRLPVQPGAVVPARLLPDPHRSFSFGCHGARLPRARRGGAHQSHRSRPPGLESSEHRPSREMGLRAPLLPLVHLHPRYLGATRLLWE